MTHAFDDKTVLITGGARGQGAAEARLFAQNGANVIVADVLDTDGIALAKELGEKARYRRLDVTSETDWLNAARFAHETFGGLHVLVNNAGIALRGKNIGATTRQDWDRVLAVNLTGPFLGTRAAAPLIRDSGGGAIVNIGSTAGINGHFAAAYSAAKWGLRGLTKCAASRRRHHADGGGVGYVCRSHDRSDGATPAGTAGRCCPSRDVPGK